MSPTVIPTLVPTTAPASTSTLASTSAWASTDVIAAWIAAVVAIIACAIELLVNNKAQAIKAVTENRLNWMNDVRGILIEFITEYVKKDHTDKEKLYELTCKLQMYTRNSNSDYDNVISCMKRCSDKHSKFSEADLNKLIAGAQYMLNQVWIRIKVESEVVLFRDEKHIVKLVKKRSDKQMKDMSAGCTKQDKL